MQARLHTCIRLMYYMHPLNLCVVVDANGITLSLFALTKVEKLSVCLAGSLKGQLTEEHHLQCKIKRHTHAF